MNQKFDWSQVPMGCDGFVNYTVIPSYPIRIMIMEAEERKLSAEYSARRKWQKTDANIKRLEKLENRLRSMSRWLSSAQEMMTA